ncbi:hypothetical protein [Pleurocapsa sp. FMAR1]|uniref:hypothetical protein n=1 Tax=Pleurocapsa sp. FMAR1 TaxID=3040204 RepID=UPI0029C72541|nr:hypothetical protein [Pleurocapsa sp. FMAR1]
MSKVYPQSQLILLTPHDRPIKLPLQKWTQIVSDRLIYLKSITENSPSKYIKIASCFNLAALIEAYAGRVDNAAQLCHAQLHWLFRIFETTSSLEALVSSLQPWINLEQTAKAKERQQIIQAAGYDFNIEEWEIAKEQILAASDLNEGELSDTELTVVNGGLLPFPSISIE